MFLGLYAYAFFFAEAVEFVGEAEIGAEIGAEGGGEGIFALIDEIGDTAIEGSFIVSIFDPNLTL